MAHLSEPIRTTEVPPALAKCQVMGFLDRLRKGGGRETPAPFVVGVARSGTTLLRMMLDAHPALAIPPETHFIPKLIKACEDPGADARENAIALLRGHRRWPDFQLDADELSRRFDQIEPFSAGEALRAFYSSYAADQRKERWGDKTPGYARRMRKIESVLPEAHFIHLIRDGRDVTLSQLEVHHGAESVEGAAKNWVGGIEKARRNAGRVRNYIEVRYEDLVAEPEPVLRRICAFIALPFDDAMLSYHERADERMSEIARDFDRQGESAISAEVRASQHSRVASPPQTARAGRWRTEMSETDRKAFEAVAADLLADLGYELENSAGNG